MEIFTRSKSRNDWLLVFVLTFLAFGLRWPGIDAALSSDEATSFLMFSESSWQIVLFMVPLDADVYFFKEMMHLKNQENYFDGIQMYVLPAEKVVVMPP